MHENASFSFKVNKLVHKQAQPKTISYISLNDVKQNAPQDFIKFLFPQGKMKAFGLNALASHLKKKLNKQ